MVALEFTVCSLSHQNLLPIHTNNFRQMQKLDCVSTLLLFSVIIDHVYVTNSMMHHCNWCFIKFYLLKKWGEKNQEYIYRVCYTNFIYNF